MVIKDEARFEGCSMGTTKKAPYAPSSRVGCSMTNHKGRGILFGGVYDEEETEDGLKSTFTTTFMLSKQK